MLYRKGENTIQIIQTKFPNDLLVYNFVEGSKLQNIQVFCGFGTRKIYQNAYKYSDKVGGKPEEWQHTKGFGLIDTPEGHKRAEVH